MKLVRKINLHRSPLLRYFLGLMISALTLYLALRNVAIDEFATAFRQALPRFMVYGFISVVCNNMAKTFRWRVLLGPAGKQISIWKLFLALMAGQTLNAIYPARMGDLSRALVIGSAGPGRVYTLGTIVIEKVLDMMAYAILFLMLILLMPLPAWVNSSAYTLILVTILITGATLLVTLFPARFMTFVGRLAQIFPARISGYVRERLQYAVHSLDVLQSRTGLAWLAVWSALIWGTAILTNHLTLLALQIHLPLIASLLVLVALQAGISIPSVPGSIGVFEYICVLALAIFQVDQAAALSFAIILHMLVFLPIISLGLIAVWFLDLGNGKKGQVEPELSTLEKPG